MSSVYTPSPVDLTPFTIPSDGDGPHIKVADVNVALEALGDGVAFNRAGLVPVLSPVASLTALAAIPTPADGTLRHVLGFGWYVFQTSATTGLFPFRVPAADSTPGGWVASHAHQTTMTRQAPVAYRVRGITNGGTGTTPAPVAPTSIYQNFIALGAADGVCTMSSFEPYRVNTGATTNYGYLVDINADLVDGATLTSATLFFNAFGHAGLPARQPSFGIMRTLVSTAFGTQANLIATGGGLVTLNAANLAAYDTTQGLVFVPTQNAVIDKSQYQYAAVIFDEAGTNASAGGLGFAGCSYQSISLFMSLPDGRRT